MTRKASLACAGALAAAASLTDLSSAFAHVVVGNRMFPATLDIDDPGVNDELAIPAFAYTPNPDFSNQFDFTFQWQKTITADLAFSIGDTLTHLTHTTLPNGNIGTLTGWGNLDTQLEYQFYVNPEHEFIVSGAVDVTWGGTGNTGSGIADPDTSITFNGYVGKGFGDLETEWLRPVAVTGELSYSFSTNPNTYLGGVLVNQTPTTLSYGATLQYSLLYMNSYVHEVPEFFRKLIPDFECTFTSPVSNIGPSVPGSIPGSHETTGVVGPGLYYIDRIGPVTFQLGAVMDIPINYASGRHIGAMAILDLFLDDMFPNSLGKPLFGPSQPRPAGGLY